MVVLWGWLCPWWCQALLFCLGLVKTGVLGVQLSKKATKKVETGEEAEPERLRHHPHPHPPNRASLN